MTHHGIIHAQSEFDGLTPSERAMSKEMDERDRIIMELQASEARLVEACEFLFGQLDNLVNRHYGGDLPCTDDEAARFDAAEAAIASAKGEK